MITFPCLRSVLLAAILSSFLVSCAVAHGKKEQAVTYDGRSLIVNGKRELLYSGSIHYPRSTPDMWPSILAKARRGGLNVIQTYVFWNIHEPVQGQYNFTGNYDLVKFIKLVQEHGMFVTLRLGPFIQAEWNHGGLPFWLREVPGIIFRSDNEPWKHHMEKYVKMVLDKCKAEKLFAPQGGPIILAQIENEYSAIQRAYRALGDSYVQWAAKMAQSMNIGVPWAMCKQNDAPDPMINACNGRHCGDTFPGPNSPNKPAIWTENWTAQFRVFGDPPSQRSAEDIAFSVARFFSKNGTLVNYYMYHGGTNFGRTGAHFVTTRYYDEAPLDEYGLLREPKYGHLKHLHRALNLCKKALLWGEPRVERLEKDVEVRYYQQPGTKVCAAFLANNDTKQAKTVKFKGQEFLLPSRSISILPDCKTVVFNTATIVAQHNSRSYHESEKANKNLNFEMYSENIPTRLSDVNVIPHELFGLTKDVSDYAWYTTTIKLDPEDLPMKKDILPVLRVSSLGHALAAFVNGEYVGNAHGSHEEKSFVFQKPIKLHVGVNDITILGMLTGFPDSGAYLEHRYAGPRGISILGLNTGTLDLTENFWGHRVGLEGEKASWFTEEGSQKLNWKKAGGNAPAFTWYKTYFDAPESDNPVVVRMDTMGKGMIWVNGNNIGRFWTAFKSPLGQPSQSEYHVPRAYLKPKDNLLVILDEEPGVEPNKIQFLLVKRDTICSHISETYPPNVKSWTREKNKIRPVVDEVKLMASLKCPSHKQIVAVEFTSFGNPFGSCGSFYNGNCTAPGTKEIVEKYCLGKESCSIPFDRSIFLKNNDGCADSPKSLAIQVKCGGK
ncbi:beta-galactosidase 13-like [Carica papaya]|uniref:beta-galactosidase 13-like n=1 Tax=Carica papaya TaxID=3649 RepID=UPI000B8CA0C9|nr:beta-galactosidase 13-like [Carica papaya]